ncbi:MAG: hypothetical protein ABMB14_18570 [Myxococcota bacterium]
MGGMITGWLVLTSARAACPPPEPLVEALETAVVEGRWTDVAPASDALVAAFGCGPPAEPALIGRVWLAEAMHRSAQGDEPAADEALWAAGHLAPTTWSDLYGAKFRARWEAAQQGPAPSSGLLHLDGLPSGWIGAVDGAVTSFPAYVSGGLHLLQVGPTPDPMATARIVEVPPGLDVRVALDPGSLGFGSLAAGSTHGPVPVASPVRTGNRARRVITAVVVGGVGAGLYGASFGTSAVYRSDPDRYDGLRTVNNGLVIGASGAALTSGVLLIRGLVSDP